MKKKQTYLVTKSVKGKLLSVFKDYKTLIQFPASLSTVTQLMLNLGAQREPENIYVYTLHIKTVTVEFSSFVSLLKHIQIHDIHYRK